MSIFYYDNKINEFEKKLNYNRIIEYLEDSFAINKKVEILNTLIAYSWYFAVEGDVNQEPLNYSAEYFLIKWKIYLEKGIKEFQNDLSFNIIASYTLRLHWFYLGENFEKLSKELTENSVKNLKESHLENLAKHLFCNSLNKNKHKKLENVEKICNKLFPTNSILDSYFREIITQQIY